MGYVPFIAFPERKVYGYHCLNCGKTLPSCDKSPLSFFELKFEGYCHICYYNLFRVPAMRRANELFKTWKNVYIRNSFKNDIGFSHKRSFLERLLIKLRIKEVKLYWKRI